MPLCFKSIFVFLLNWYMQTLLIELTSHCSLCSLTGCQLLYSALFVRLFLCCCCCAALLFPLLPPFLFFLHSSSLYCAFLSSSLPPADHWDALNSFLAVAGWDFLMDLNALKQWLAGTSSWISMHSSSGWLGLHHGSQCTQAVAGWDFIMDLNALRQWLAGTSSWISMHSSGGWLGLHHGSQCTQAVAGWDFIMDLNALKQWLAGTSSWISMHSRGMLMAHGIQAMLGSCCSIPLKGTTPLPALNWEMVCELMCIFKECVIA